ncbi:hypothetical protein [Aestuariispira ectoiniformans]|uniref:hypothetical protein n=1 Tax=Aestuariispira ectoiniformans TaxID=2775080 RepID=UPI00223AF2A5|nr:hypothetical protein [Aestuariispira ectoiniformans]
MVIEVNLPPQTTPQQQQPQQQSLNATAQAGATATEQTSPDNVVTATTDLANPNTREEDASRRESRGDRQSPLATLENLKINGLNTRLEYDNDHEVVFLEILQPRTEEVVQKIPSEKLVEYLSEQAKQVLAEDVAYSDSALDRSI